MVIKKDNEKKNAEEEGDRDEKGWLKEEENEEEEYEIQFQGDEEAS